MRRLKKFINSIFAKLLVVIILTGLFINLAVVGFFWSYRARLGRPFHKNIAQYLNYLTEDLGSPPNLNLAKEMADRTDISIHFEGQNLSWSTAGKFPTTLPKRMRFLQRHPNIRAGFTHGRHCLELKNDQGRFIFEFALNVDRDPLLRWLPVFLLLILTIILAGAYFSLRYILRPVKWLDDGVQQVSKGNLKHQIPLKRSDELRDLSAAFNTMTMRIREMLKAKEQLMLDVSHELRSPITRMKVALELLPESGIKQSIQTDLAEMGKMISEILDTASLHHMHSKLNPQRLNIATLIQDVLQEFEKQTPGVQIEKMPKGIECDVDPEQIKTVLRNVLNNAQKYSRAESEPVKVSLLEQSPNVIIRVEDNGIGIPHKDLPFIFEPFYRTDKSRSKETGGYGLGLSLCKTILEAHGGKIEIESIVNEGTKIYLYIPESKD